MSVSGLQVIPNSVVTLVPPDTDRINVIDSNKLEHKDSRIGKFSVLPLDFRDPSIRNESSGGGGAGYLLTRRGVVTYYASCVPPARRMRGTFPL